MILELSFSDPLRLRGAQGAAIEVLDGTVWITEKGSAGDRFLGAGSRYRVRGDGLVVVGAEGRAPIARVEVRAPAHWALGWLAGLPRVRDLSDRMLRDVGLRRDQIP